VLRPNHPNHPNQVLLLFEDEEKKYNNSRLVCSLPAKLEQGWKRARADPIHPTRARAHLVLPAFYPGWLPAVSLGTMLATGQDCQIRFRKSDI
jgi:hypothetical protein